MKVKTPKNSPIAVLYTAAKEIVDGTRKAFVEQGHDGREIRLPILMHGTDMRVTIEAGPAVAARNAIEHAQMQVSGKPVEPPIDMTKALKEAQELLWGYAQTLSDQCTGNRGDWLDQFADEKIAHDRAIAVAKQLEEVERLV